MAVLIEDMAVLIEDMAVLIEDNSVLEVNVPTHPHVVFFLGIVNISSSKETFLGVSRSSCNVFS
jgi:hypothetical protein